MAKETRKLRRAAERDKTSGKSKKAALKAPISMKPGEMPDPLGPEQLKSTLVRVGLIIAGLWILGGSIAGVSVTPWIITTALAVPAVLTVVILGVLFWTFRRVKAARGVASILQGVETEEDRKAALAQLDISSGKVDPAKVFAKAQLEMQEDPKKALQTLEQINLDKVSAPVADQARTQRAMIHLTQGEVNLARQLVDNVELKRTQDAPSRAMMGAILAEAWARSGQAKKALETLELFDMEGEELAQLRPQIYRAYAFAYAHLTRTKDLRRVLRKMLAIDVRLLGGFMMKRTHPLLQKEARQIVERSGMVPRKMQVQRMR